MVCKPHGSGYQTELKSNIMAQKKASAIAEAFNE